VLALLWLLAVPAAASADTSWTRVSSTAAEPVFGQSLDWTFDGTSVAGVWVVENGTMRDLEVVRFTPSRAAEAAGLTFVRPPTLVGWDFMDATVLPAAAGGVQALVAGQFGTQLGPPTGTSLVPLTADGSAGPLQLLGPRTPNTFTAVLGPSGPLWVGDDGSTLRTYVTGAQPAFDFTGAGRPINGCCGYIPRVAFDRSGRLWLAFYSNATSQTGVYMGQLDPATGALVGALTKAPRSETSDNNSRKLAFACADVCRVAYEETAADAILPTGRIVTWAPGEADATVVTGAAGARLVNPAIAFRADGRLWVAWVDADKERIAATLGDARGAGGRVLNAGSPPLPPLSSLYGTDALPLGNDVLLNVNAGAGQNAGAQWVNLVLEPGAVDTGDVPNPKIVTSPGGKLVYPGTVTSRCVRVRPVADKPARIWAQVFTGKKGGTAISNRVSFRFAAPGATSKCVTLRKRPKGFYTGKPFHILFEVRTGATAKPIERTRPPWRTQPQIKITL
jgi:hypothetical protein